ncbi:MAG: hypothetical protein PVF83_09165, partial [Anaerolineales bacterium]
MTGITFLELIGLIADIKELAPLLGPLKRKDLKEIYIDALEGNLEQESPYLEGQLFFEKEKFSKELNYRRINLRNLPVQPEYLTEEIGEKIIELLTDNNIIYGVEVDEDWAKKIVNANHQSYYRNVFSQLPVEGIRLGLTHLSDMVATSEEQEEIISLLLSILQELQAKDELPGTLISSDLIQSYKETSQEVVIGSRITIEQLRDKRFMERPRRIADALNEIDRLINEKKRRTEPKIHTFWIDGRSGCGKSVFLLQIMQKLVLERNSLVFWLDDASESVYPLLSKWLASDFSNNDTAFVFVDDFYDPLSRDKVDFMAISRLLRNPHYAKVNWPILVTCGPPEHHENFIQSGDAESFRLKIWRLPPIVKTEQKDILEWYEERAGKGTKTGEAFTQAEGLILSMMVELKHGVSLLEFGRKFSRRLKNVGLVDALIEPLALNRLYIWTPQSWLEEWSTENREAFIELNSDKDFSLLSEKPDAQGYIRLTHPHLSDDIYKAIRPKESGLSRAVDLANAFHHALNTDMNTAFQILRIIAENPPRISGDLDSKTLVEKTIYSWNSSKFHESKFSPNQLAVLWTNWARWAAREPDINKLLGPPPTLLRAKGVKNVRSDLWGVLWQNLWKSYPGDVGLTEDAWSWLLRLNTKGVTSWSHVWRALLEHTEHLPEGITVDGLVRMGFEWLSGREEREEWAFVWRALLEHTEHLPEGITVDGLVRMGFEWLSGREER